MNKLEVKLENCYGISKLDYNFDLEIKGKSKGVYSIYAPNGFMKSSFARTFEDIQFGRESKDLVFSERQTSRDIKIDGEEITSECVFVIKPYIESYSSEKTSLLLVNETLKKQYDQALEEIEKSKKSLISTLKKVSGYNSRKEAIENVLCKAFDKSDKEFYKLLKELSEEKEDYSEFSEINYAEIFNDQVRKLLASGNISKELEDYIQTYDKLIDQSPVLTRKFNHQNAASVSKNLNDTGFFGATHTVTISLDKERKEITSQKELNDLVAQEQNKVISDKDLQTKFEAIDKKLSNAETKKFREFAAEHKTLLPELKNPEEFERKLWLAYLQSNRTELDNLVEVFEKNKTTIEAITQTAKEQQTTWEGVVDKFNKRFNVPFKLKVVNQEDVILQSAKPTIAFEFNDGRAEKNVEQNILLDVLSQGEKRALYILNLLFEIEVRIQENTPTLFIIDDIADSFDYKNKYSIVEYLQIVANISFFKIILLTHNFDFHRTACSRIGIYGLKRLFAVKTDASIELVREKYQKDVLKFWKDQLAHDDKCVIACIPFARNLAEYCGLHTEYEALTSLLHLKTNTNDIRVSDLQEIYRTVFSDKATVELQVPQSTVVDTLEGICDELLEQSSEVAQLEDKIILSIAIRLEAEKFMISKINDDEFVQGIESFQTKELFERYVNDFEYESNNLSLLDQVNLMTPENIHLNSFMYEPILDMSANHLYALYKQVKELNNE